MLNKLLEHSLVLVIVGAVLLFTLSVVGGYYFYKNIQISSPRTVFCEMLKPKYLKHPENCK